VEILLLKGQYNLNHGSLALLLDAKITAYMLQDEVGWEKYPDRQLDQVEAEHRQLRITPHA